MNHSPAAFSSPYGGVRVYTRRHVKGCTLISTEDNSCPCPKWIYSKARDGKASQTAAKTSSLTEACEKARRILAGFRPAEVGSAEIAAPGGTVHIYTRRHINGCPLVSTSDNGCSCPKWIYWKPRGGRAMQKAAKTGSFSEALQEAAKIGDFIPARPLAQSLEDLKLIETGKKFLHTRGPGRLATARLRLMACVKADHPELSDTGYEMTDHLNPGPPRAKDARRTSLSQFSKWAKTEPSQVEMRRIQALPKIQRDDIAAEARVVIQNERRSRKPRKSRLFH